MARTRSPEPIEHAAGTSATGWRWRQEHHLVGVAPGGFDRHVGVIVRSISVGLRRGVVVDTKHGRRHTFDEGRDETSAALRYQEEGYVRDGGKRERCYDSTIHRFWVNATRLLDSYELLKTKSVIFCSFGSGGGGVDDELFHSLSRGDFGTRESR